MPSEKREERKKDCLLQKEEEKADLAHRDRVYMSFVSCRRRGGGGQVPRLRLLGKVAEVVRAFVHPDHGPQPLLQQAAHADTRCPHRYTCTYTCVAMHGAYAYVHMQIRVYGLSRLRQALVPTIQSYVSV